MRRPRITSYSIKAIIISNKNTIIRQYTGVLLAGYASYWTLWNGMVNMLSKQEVDLGITPFTITQDRSTVATFSTPLFQIYHSLFIKNPAETFNYTAYIKPMHWLSWVGLFIFSICVPPLLFLTTR